MGLEQPGLVEDVPDHGSGWNERSFNVPSHHDSMKTLIHSSH